MEMVAKRKNQLDKQAFILFAAILLIIVCIVFAPYAYHQFFDKFSYHGVSFEKIKNNQLTFYHGTFPVIYLGKVYTNYNLYLRTDPRQNLIPINTEVTLSKNISVSLDMGSMGCKNAILGQSLLGQFFNSFPWVKKVETTTSDYLFAKESNWSYITCKNATIDHTVFIIQKSQNASIEKGDKDNCFILNIGECKYLETSERLVLGIIAQINDKKV